MRIEKCYKGSFKVYSLLVLGLIPGTDIQIGFSAWVVMMIVLLIGFKLYRQRVARAVRSLAMETWKRFEGHYDLVRQPLHASQLHRRLTQTAR